MDKTMVLTKNRLLAKQVINTSIWNLIYSIIQRIGALIFTIILARFLFPENFGIYSLVISIAFIFMTFADLGIDNVLIRYLSSEKKKSAYFRYIFKIKFLFSSIVSLALLIFAYPISLIYKI